MSRGDNVATPGWKRVILFVLLSTCPSALRAPTREIAFSRL